MLVRSGRGLLFVKTTMTSLEEAPALEEQTPMTQGPILARYNGENLHVLPQDLYIPPDALELFLESFEGPFDLLLYLIRKQRLDLNAISVASVTDQYMQYVEQIRAHNMELASDYLVMAADLMMIKSRMLLPIDPSTISPTEDITGRILREVAEYEKIQLGAQLLSALPTMGDGFWGTHVLAPSAPKRPQPQVLPQELARVWLRVLRNAKLKMNHTIARQELSIHEFMTSIVKGLNDEPFIEFLTLLKRAGSKQAQVVNFLAVLELSRQGLISVNQACPYAPIYLSKRKSDTVI